MIKSGGARTGRQGLYITGVAASCRPGANDVDEEIDLGEDVAASLSPSRARMMKTNMMEGRSGDVPTDSRDQSKYSTTLPAGGWHM